MSTVDKIFMAYILLCTLAIFLNLELFKKVWLSKDKQPQPIKQPRKLIYIAQPYGGLQTSAELAQDYFLRLVRIHPDKDFITPITAFGFAYEILNYDRGMELCEALLLRCDELWIINDTGKSVGVNRERAAAKKDNMRIRDLTWPEAGEP